MGSTTSMTCKLTSPELQERKLTIISELKKLVIERIPLENGFSYQFQGDDQTIDFLIDFIKTERQCCDFFNFNLAINTDNTVVLNITGEKGVKEFIAAELEL